MLPSHSYKSTAKKLELEHIAIFGQATRYKKSVRCELSYAEVSYMEIFAQYRSMQNSGPVNSQGKREKTLTG